MTLIPLIGLMQTCRAAHPLVTDDTLTQDACNWQLEINSDWYQRRAGPISRAAAVELSYGATSNVDVYISPAPASPCAIEAEQR